MVWVEHWLGVSPDGGDGSLEWLLIFLAVMVVVAAVLVFSRRARTSFLRLVGTIALGALRTRRS